ncbi:exosortase A [Pseudorhodoferax sp. Leaf267]|uniref:exosortase A n=1 Tax=Pseudorhodoferax sp. Leaf267 TaxID=1736316 RepID=UPI0006F358D3|nr:exosortase A [Pseudorhodoferax sp. Leaf267]KQP23154.1 exosortase A [Pseudorhodoferax sp. Leaf267]
MLTRASSPSMPQHWRGPLAAFVLVVGLLLVLYRDTVVGMVSIWERSDTYAHGFLVVPIVLWLVWRQRHRVADLVPRPSLVAVLLMLGAVALWLAGDLVAVNAATQLAFTMLLVLAVPAVLGWQVAWALLFPLSFMFFAVPIGDFMMPMLMEWTADFTVVALRLSGIPVYREGQQFVIPSGHWSVVEACSGIRYLIASVTVGSLFAYLNYQSPRRRALFVLVSILVPLVANWLRAYIIVMLGHYSGNTLATGVDHLVYGWLFFGIVILIMFAIGAKWSEPSPDLEARPSLAPPGTAWRARPAVLAALCAVLVLPHGVIWALERAQNHAAPQLALQGLQDGWQSGAVPSPDWKPAFHNPSAELVQGAAKDGRQVGVYIGYYRGQGNDRKLVSSINQLVPTTNKDWSEVSAAGGTAPWAGTPVPVRTAELRASLVGDVKAARLLAWQVYWVNDRLIASDAMAKIHGAVSRLSGRGDDSAVVVIYTPTDGTGSARQTLESFVQANGALIQASLQQTRQR